MSSNGSDRDLPPLLERMKPFADVKGDAQEVHDWVGEIEQDLETLQWMAAGGRGMASRESVIEKIDTQIRNLQTLREQVEDLEDPRELGEEARSLRTDTDESESGESR